MFVELGDRELDMSIYALELLKIYKIQSMNNDFKQATKINIEALDREYMSYNEGYGQVEDNIFENLIKKISSKIIIKHYEPDEFFFIEDNINDIPEEEKEDFFSDIHIIIIPIKSKNPRAITDKFKKVVTSFGTTEEFFDEVVFYNDGCIHIIMDTTAAIDVLLDSTLVELLYEYRNSGVLPC